MQHGFFYLLFIFHLEATYLETHKKPNFPSFKGD